MAIKDQEQVVFHDGSGEDEESSENVVDLGTYDDGSVWVSIENCDGEITFWLNKENWELLKANIDKRFT